MGTFSHHSIPLEPLTYTTPQFGGEWGTLPFTFPNSVSGPSNSFYLDNLMSKMKSAGLHVVEAIPATSEGIAAGKLADKVILVHGKVDSPNGRVDVTVKCGDNELGQNLSSFLGQVILN